MINVMGKLQQVRMAEREVGCGLQKSEAISPRIHLSRDLNEGSEQCGYLGEYSR